MTIRTVIVGWEKPHIRLKDGLYWCFQRAKAHGPRRVKFRIGKGVTAEASYRRFCSNPIYSTL